MPLDASTAGADAAAQATLCRDLRLAGRLDEAIAHGRRAVELNPKHAEAHVHLAAAYAVSGQIEQAIAHARHAISIQPNHVEALNYLAWCLTKTGQLDEAESAARRAVQAQPNYVAALDQLARLLMSRRQLDEALELWRRAVVIEPGQAHLWHALASCEDRGELSEAIACHRKTVALAPRWFRARSDLLLTLHHDPDITDEELFAEHRQYQLAVVPQVRRFINHSNGRDANRHIKIGYVSPYFRQHAVMSFVEPILRSHDRGRFEISCYADTAQSADENSVRLKSYAENWHDTTKLTDQQLADLVFKNKEDVLVDLTGHIGSSRLVAFAHKPAPVQLTYIGYQNTTGLDAMNYRITDAVADPPGVTDRFYVEKLVRLPCFFCYDPPREAPEVSPLPMQSSGVVTFGSLNNFAKVNDRVIELWSRILRSVPNSRLLLLLNAAGVAEKRTIERFAIHGVDSSRLFMIQRLSRRDYFHRFNQIDIALDPFPFSGHTTTCDALWMGVPVVTLAGTRYAARMSASVLHHLGLPELIAQTPDEYARIVLNLASDPARLSDHRRGLRDRMKSSPITDAAGFTRELEKAYRQMWHMWCADK